MEQKILESLWAQWGAIGVLLSCLCFALVKLWARMIETEKDHNADRVVWRQQLSEQNKAMTEAYHLNTSALTELSTILRECVPGWAERKNK